MINSIKEKPYSIIYFIQSPHAQFAEGLYSYIVKKIMKFFFPRKVKDLHQGLPPKRNPSSPASERKDSGCYRVLLLCSPLVLSWPQARQRETHAARSLPVALLSAGEGVVTNTAGSCWRKVVDSLWSSEQCTDQISCSADCERVGKAGELAPEQPMQGSEFHS